MEQFTRNVILIGEEKQQKISNSHVMVFGLGGVGSYVVEALARAGVGHFTIVDNDNVAISNLNRQIIALHSTIGKPKVEVAKSRILDINPNCRIDIYNQFVLPCNLSEINFEHVDYIVDAIDTVAAKIAIIEKATTTTTPIICAMGTGNKLDPSRLEITDIAKTSVCPLARVMRYELRKRGINHLLVVYSKEEPTKINANETIVGSVAFVPSVAGLLIASRVINDIIND